MGTKLLRSLGGPIPAAASFSGTWSLRRVSHKHQSLSPNLTLHPHSNIPNSSKKRAKNLHAAYICGSSFAFTRTCGSHGTRPHKYKPRTCGGYVPVPSSRPLYQWWDQAGRPRSPCGARRLPPVCCARDPATSGRRTLSDHPFSQ